jgi:hypothetical protein
MSKKKNPTFGHSPDKTGEVNPFFRGDESYFDGGELTVRSSVGSVFSHDYLRSDGSNAMEDELSEQLRDQGGSSRQVSYTKKGK